jgi:hypothetical protein
MPVNRAAKSPSAFERWFFVLSFLTLNLEILPGGEYQPLGFIFLIGVVAVRVGGLRRTPMRAAFLFLYLATIVFLIRGLSFYDVARIASIFIFLSSGSLLVNLVDRSVMKIIVAAHIVVLGVGLALPSLIIGALGSLFPRGVTYYSGFNSFFSSEPSYAALNLFGVYVLHRVYCKKFEQVFRATWIELGIVLCLIATYSVTGIILAGCIVLEYFLSPSPSRLKRVLRLAIVPLVCLSGIIYFGEILLSSERLSSFVYFLSSIDLSDFLLSWTLLEPSSSTRFISNAAAVVEGVTSIIGTGTFALSGPDVVFYPSWLRLAFDSNGIVGAGSSPQTPIAGLILFGGVLGIIFSLYLLVRAFAEIRRLPAGGKLLFFFFIGICAFWQAAVTYPFFWVFISALLGVKRRGFKAHSVKVKSSRYLSEGFR